MRSLRHPLFQMTLCFFLMTGTACSAAIPSTSNPTPSVSSSDLVGTAGDRLRSLADQQSRDWYKDAELVKIEGISIDEDGYNSGATSEWRYLYRSTLAAKGFTVIVGRGAIKGIEIPDQPQGESIKQFTIDSDDALLRYKHETKRDSLQRVNMSLGLGANSQLMWNISVLDERSSILNNGQVNASSGLVIARVKS